MSITKFEYEEKKSSGGGTPVVTNFHETKRHHNRHHTAWPDSTGTHDEPITEADIKSLLERDPHFGYGT